MSVIYNKLVDWEIEDIYNDPMFAAKETEPTLKEYDFWSYINYLFIGIDAWESRRDLNKEYEKKASFGANLENWEKIKENKTK